MTFCIGLKCAEGLVALADTQLTTGTVISSAKKVSVHQSPTHTLFVLTSGLRSVRDKAITYFEERLQRDEASQSLRRVYHAANALADEVRRVYNEDQSWLAASGLPFDLSLIIGGQMEDDEQHHLYLIYPQGNWIEVDASTPYVLIGESSYGKPLLDRFWNCDRSLSEGLRVGLLAFDATRISTTSVGAPLDAVVYVRDSFEMREQRFMLEELAPLSQYWRGTMNQAVESTASLVDPLIQDLLGRGVGQEHAN
jgi:putative proteasome-type protease